MNTSNRRHLQMTRDQVLVAHAAEMIARTSLSQDDFAASLGRALYSLAPEKAAEKDVPDFEALAESNDGPAFVRATGRWLKRVQRWMEKDGVEIPSWIEEAWVTALLPEYRERCINELARRHGLIGARALGTDACAISAFAQLVIRLGQAVEVGSEVLADGKIDSADLAHLPDFIEKLLAVESRACELRRRAENELAIHFGGKPLKVVG
ncbi:hypothetical protein NG726_11685 [Pseudomonas sp. MOB-449]|nr:hypothetical protein [Pseudomonas sp. MOB-449]